MFDVKQAAAKAMPVVVINACAVCEHRHPAGCGFCDLDHTAKNDPWWPREDVKERLNVASGEDVVV